MKRVRGIALLGCLLISLMGCSNGGNVSEKEPTEKAETQQTAQASSEQDKQEVTAAWNPEKDITFIVPFEAGGAADIPARIVAKYMSKYSSKPITVVNMPGSGGRIGAKEVMNSKADGYTIMHVPVGWYMQYSMGIADFSYADFENITMWCDSWVGLVVKSDSPYKTYEDFIAAAKADPGKMTVGAVSGTLPVLAELAIADKEGVEFNMVDFGTGAKAPELLSGRVEAYVDGMGAIKQYVDGGQFRCLTVFAHEPVAGFEDVPIAETIGYKDFNYLLQSFGMWAPKGTPKEAVDYIANLVKQVSEDPECVKELETLGYGARYETPENYAAICKSVQDSTTTAVQPLLGK